MTCSETMYNIIYNTIRFIYCLITRHECKCTSTVSGSLISREHRMWRTQCTYSFDNKINLIIFIRTLTLKRCVCIKTPRNTWIGRNIETQISHEGLRHCCDDITNTIHYLTDSRWNDYLCVPKHWFSLKLSQLIIRIR
jgi:hypothetical protein